MTAGWSSLVWFVSHLVKQLLEREASYLSRKCLLNWTKKKERLPLPRRMLSVLSSSHALLCLPETPRDSLSWLSKVWEMFEEFSNPLSDLWKHTPPLAQYKIQYSVIKIWASEITRGGVLVILSNCVGQARLWVDLQERAEDGLPLVLDVSAYGTQPVTDVTTHFLGTVLTERVIQSNSLLSYIYRRVCWRAFWAQQSPARYFAFLLVSHSQFWAALDLSLSLNGFSLISASKYQGGGGRRGGMSHANEILAREWDG